MEDLRLILDALLAELTTVTGPDSEDDVVAHKRRLFVLLAEGLGDSRTSAELIRRYMDDPDEVEPELSDLILMAGLHEDPEVLAAANGVMQFMVDTDSADAEYADEELEDDGLEGEDADELDEDVSDEIHTGPPSSLPGILPDD